MEFSVIQAKLTLALKKLAGIISENQKHHEIEHDEDCHPLE